MASDSHDKDQALWQRYVAAEHEFPAARWHLRREASNLTVLLSTELTGHVADREAALRQMHSPCLANLYERATASDNSDIREVAEDARQS